MKTFFRNNWSVGILAFSILFLASCGTDDPTDTAIKPSVTASSASSTATPGGVISVELDALKGDNDMSQLIIQLDGVNLSTSSFDIIEEAVENNPMLLLGTYTSSFTFNIDITAPETAGSYSYTFQVADSEGNASTETIDIDVTAPSVPPTLTDGNGYTGNDNPETAGATFTINLAGVMSGADNLESITFMAGGVNIATEKVRYDGASTLMAIDANPYMLTTDDQSGFSKNYYITAHDDISTKAYKIILTSASGLTSEIMFDITTSPDGTALTTNASTVLVYNNGGPNFGGLDLYTGTAVSTTSGTYQVKDAGINGDGDWLKQLTTKTGEGVTFRSLGSMPDGWSFSTVAFKEEVKTAWDNGSDMGDTTSSLSTSDVIVAKHGENYFLLWMESVVETTGDNLDYYELSVKG